MEKETELSALNREIAQKQAKLRSLNDGELEFEIVLDHGEDDRHHHQADNLAHPVINGIDCAYERFGNRVHVIRKLGIRTGACTTNDLLLYDFRFFFHRRAGVIIGAELCKAA